MTESSEFAARIRARYPEGLTGIFALGGTRTTYVLTQNHQKNDPGRIDKMQNYADYGSHLLRQLFGLFFDLGGQNLVGSVLSYQQLHSERGAEYAQVTAALTRILMEGKWLDFYHQQQVDPYFVGIDTLLHLPEDSFAHQLGAECQRFNQTWAYQAGRRKVIWEVAAMPLYSIWNARQVMGEAAHAAFEAEMAAAADLQAMHDLLYRYYARAAYGTDLPVPHFYLGSNRNGDLKLRSLLPVALLCGGPFRMFYTPYPTLFTTAETMRAILEDLAFGSKGVQSTHTDYSGQLAPEVVEHEYQRVLELSANPMSTAGFFRRVQAADNG